MLSEAAASNEEQSKECVVSPNFPTRIQTNRQSDELCNGLQQKTEYKEQIQENQKESSPEDLTNCQNRVQIDNLDEKSLSKGHEKSEPLYGMLEQTPLDGFSRRASYQNQLIQPVYIKVQQNTKNRKNDVQNNQDPNGSLCSLSSESKKPKSHMSRDLRLNSYSYDTFSFNSLSRGGMASKKSQGGLNEAVRSGSGDGKQQRFKALEVTNMDKHMRFQGGAHESSQMLDIQKKTSKRQFFIVNYQNKFKLQQQSSQSHLPPDHSNVAVKIHTKFVGTPYQNRAKNQAGDLQKGFNGASPMKIPRSSFLVSNSISKKISGKRRQTVSFSNQKSNDQNYDKFNTIAKKFTIQASAEQDVSPYKEIICDEQIISDKELIETFLNSETKNSQNHQVSTSKADSNMSYQPNQPQIRVTIDKNIESIGYGLKEPSSGIKYFNISSSRPGGVDEPTSDSYFGKVDKLNDCDTSQKSGQQSQNEFSVCDLKNNLDQKSEANYINQGSSSPGFKQIENRNPPQNDNQFEPQNWHKSSKVLGSELISELLLENQKRDDVNEAIKQLIELQEFTHLKKLNVKSGIEYQDNSLNQINNSVDVDNYQQAQMSSLQNKSLQFIQNQTQEFDTKYRIPVFNKSSRFQSVDHGQQLAGRVEVISKQSVPQNFNHHDSIFLLDQHMSQILQQNTKQPQKGDKTNKQQKGSHRVVLSDMNKRKPLPLQPNPATSIPIHSTIDKIQALGGNICRNGNRALMNSKNRSQVVIIRNSKGQPSASEEPPQKIVSTIARAGLGKKRNIEAQARKIAKNHTTQHLGEAKSQGKERKKSDQQQANALKNTQQGQNLGLRIDTIKGGAGISEVLQILNKQQHQINVNLRSFNPYSSAESDELKTRRMHSIFDQNNAADQIKNQNNLLRTQSKFMQNIQQLTNVKKHVISQKLPPILDNLDITIKDNSQFKSNAQNQNSGMPEQCLPFEIHTLSQERPQGNRQSICRSDNLIKNLISSNKQHEKIKYRKYQRQSKLNSSELLLQKKQRNMDGARAAQSMSFIEPGQQQRIPVKLRFQSKLDFNALDHLLVDKEKDAQQPSQQIEGCKQPGGHFYLDQICASADNETSGLFHMSTESLTSLKQQMSEDDNQLNTELNKKITHHNSGKPQVFSSFIKKTAGNGTSPATMEKYFNVNGTRNEGAVMKSVGSVSNNDDSQSKKNMHQDISYNDQQNGGIYADSNQLISHMSSPDSHFLGRNTPQIPSTEGISPLKTDALQINIQSDEQSKSARDKNHLNGQHLNSALEQFVVMPVIVVNSVETNNQFERTETTPRQNGGDKLSKIQRILDELQEAPLGQKNYGNLNQDLLLSGHQNINLYLTENDSNSLKDTQYLQQPDDKINEIFGNQSLKKVKQSSRSAQKDEKLMVQNKKSQQKDTFYNTGMLIKNAAYKQRMDDKMLPVPAKKIDKFMQTSDNSTTFRSRSHGKNLMEFKSPILNSTGYLQQKCQNDQIQQKSTVIKKSIQNQNQEKPKEFQNNGLHRFGGDQAPYLPVIPNGDANRGQGVDVSVGYGGLKNTLKSSQNIVNLKVPVKDRQHEVNQQYQTECMKLFKDRGVKVKQLQGLIQRGGDLNTDSSINYITEKVLNSGLIAKHKVIRNHVAAKGTVVKSRLSKQKRLTTATATDTSGFDSNTSIKRKMRNTPQIQNISQGDMVPLESSEAGLIPEKRHSQKTDFDFQVCKLRALNNLQNPNRNNFNSKSFAYGETPDRFGEASLLPGQVPVRLQQQVNRESFDTIKMSSSSTSLDVKGSLAGIMAAQIGVMDVKNDDKQENDAQLKQKMSVLNKNNSGQKMLKLLKIQKGDGRQMHQNPENPKIVNHQRNILINQHASHNVSQLSLFDQNINFDQDSQRMFQDESSAKQHDVSGDVSFDHQIDSKIQTKHEFGCSDAYSHNQMLANQENPQSLNIRNIILNKKSSKDEIEQNIRYPNRQQFAIQQFS